MTNATLSTQKSESTRRTIIGASDRLAMIDGQLKAVEAIIDAARVLTTLTCVSTVQNTHDLHARSCTLPDLMGHAHTLMQITRDDVANMHEAVIEELRKQGRGDGG